MRTLFDDVTYRHGGDLYREDRRDGRDLWYRSRDIDGGRFVAR